MSNLLNFKKVNLKIILIGFSIPFELRLFGSLISPFEIISLIYFINDLIFYKKKELDIFKNEIFQVISKLLILWASCQIISDILNNTDFKSSLKGAFTPILIILSLRLLLKLNEFFSEKNFFGDLLIGFSICKIFNLILINKSLEYSLKMGGFISLALMFFCLIKNKNINLLFSTIILPFSFLLGVRSAFLIFLTLIISDLVHKTNKEKNINITMIPNVLKGIFKYLFIILIFFLSSPISNFFNNQIVKFYSNQDRIETLRDQGQGGFFSARSEYFSFFDAFKDSPLIGHGSWAIDKNYKYSIKAKRGEISNQNKTNRKIVTDINQSKEKLNPDGFPYIPAHSFIQNTTIWSGIFAPFFFLYLFNLILFIVLNYNLPYSFRLLMIKYTWDIFFSPLGNHRFSLPIICMIVIFILIKKQKITQIKKLK